MRTVAEIFTRWEMIHTLLLAALLYMLPLGKRGSWLFRYVMWALALVTVFAFLRIPSVGWKADSFVTDLQYGISVFLAMPVQVALVIVVFYRCCEVSWRDAVLGTICAYATQHFADALHMLIHVDIAATNGSDRICLDGFFVYMIVFVCCYFLVASRLPEHGRYDASMPQSLAVMLLVLGFAMVFNFMAKIYQHVNPNPLFRVCMLFDMLCCMFVLWGQLDRQKVRRLTREVELEKNIRIRQKQQYEIACDSVERINRKCHELKHQISKIREMPESELREESLKEMEEAVMFYDFMVKSGNQVIDTVLTEKSLLCEQNSITWTCMADGPALEFMEEGELYFLFDCILEHAIKTVMYIENPKRRIIALTLHRRRSMAVLQIENYYEEGVPQTENDSFRTDLQQIKNILKKYHGDLDITTEDGLMLLSMLIPLPETFLQIAN